MRAIRKQCRLIHLDLAQNFVGKFLAVVIASFPFNHSLSEMNNDQLKDLEAAQEEDDVVVIDKKEDGTAAVRDQELPRQFSALSLASSRNTSRASLSGLDQNAEIGNPQVPARPRFGSRASFQVGDPQDGQSGEQIGGIKVGNPQIEGRGPNACFRCGERHWVWLCPKNKNRNVARHRGFQAWLDYCNSHEAEMKVRRDRELLATKKKRDAEDEERRLQWKEEDIMWSRERQRLRGEFRGDFYR